MFDAKLRHCRSVLGMALVLFAASTVPADDGPYQADWESLVRHQAAPEWFQDTKLGIYFHWGVYTVPAFASQWYPRLMHLPGHAVYKHHLEKDGKIVYAIMLGWPEDGKNITIQSLAADQVKVGDVSLLGCDESLPWKQTAEGLTITLPNTRPSEAAVAFKVTTK